MQARRMVTDSPLLALTRMVSPSPTEIRPALPLISVALGRGLDGARGGGAPPLLPLQRASQGMPSPSPSMRVFPDFRDRIASSQVRKLEHR